MKIFNIFNKQKYLLKLLIVIIAIILVISSIMMLKFTKIKDKNISNYNILTDIILPKIYAIDVKKNPILYDFVNSSISYKSDIDVSKYGFYYAILQDKKNKDTIYIEYYTYAEKLIFPSLGTTPILLKLNESEIAYIDDFSDKMSKNRLFNEIYMGEERKNDWRLMLISQYSSYDNKSGNNIFDHCDAVGRWAGITMNKYISSSVGLMDETINSGLGWPVDWIRKKPYYKNLLKYAGYDVKDEFWDKYNIKSFKIYKNDHGEELKVEVSQLDRFTLKIDGNYVSMKEFELKEYLNNQGWR